MRPRSNTRRPRPLLRLLSQLHTLLLMATLLCNQLQCLRPLLHSNGLLLLTLPQAIPRKSGKLPPLPNGAQQHQQPTLHLAGNKSFLLVEDNCGHHHQANTGGGNKSALAFEK